MKLKLRAPSSGQCGFCAGVRFSAVIAGKPPSLSLRGAQYPIPLSLRGSRATWQSVSSPPVIARSEATWQSVLLLVAGTKSLRGKGKRIAAPVCGLARNDRWGKVCALVLRCHCGEAVRRGNPSLPLLSLRGAKRRGNPFSFLGQVRNRYVARGNGLPRQCAHWLAMTGGGGCARWSCAVIVGKPLLCHCGETPSLSLRGSVPRGDARGLLPLT